MVGTPHKYEIWFSYDSGKVHETGALHVQSKSDAPVDTTQIIRNVERSFRPDMPADEVTGLLYSMLENYGLYRCNARKDKPSSCWQMCADIIIYTKGKTAWF